MESNKGRGVGELEGKWKKEKKDNSFGGHVISELGSPASHSPLLTMLP